MKLSYIAVLIAFCASIANAAPVDQHRVEVVDGDTVRIAGKTFRLVGFDAPETYRAQCPSEWELGNRATFRLRQLVAGGGLDLERVACACKAIAEGLAHVYVCGSHSCPARGAWCNNP
jgi:endonuclease YncB( thermonuclease family)